MWFVYLSCHVCCVCLLLFWGEAVALMIFFFQLSFCLFIVLALLLPLYYIIALCVLLLLTVCGLHLLIRCSMATSPVHCHYIILIFFLSFFFFIVVHVLLSLIFCTVWTARITFVDKLLHSDKVASSWDKTTIQQYRFSLHGAWSIVWMVHHSVFGHWWWLYLIELCVQTFGNGHCEC